MNMDNFLLQASTSDSPSPMHDPASPSRRRRRRRRNAAQPPPEQHEVRSETIEELDRAAMSAHHDLLASKENVSVWKVSQAALLMVKAESWESLGFQLQQVPSLQRLLVTEGKVNSFIHCFVAIRRISSLYDLEVAICKSEGIEHFEELELGPLARHPLAVHYFSVTSDVMEAHKIRTEQINCYICEFLDTHRRKEVNVDTFLDFVAMKQSVDSKEKLSVRIQDFGQYVKYIRASRQSAEHTVLRASAKRERKMRKLLLKKQLDDHFISISQQMKSSSENKQFCAKRMRHVASSSEMNDSDDNEYDEHQDEKAKRRSCSVLLPNVTSDHVCSCPELDNLDTNQKHMGLGNHGSHHSLADESLRVFVTNWTETCQENNADKIVTREPINYGPADSNFNFPLVNWILPYAQRSILNAYPDKYVQLKQSGFENIRYLKIVVVDKLFYRNVIKRSDITSKKRHECNCLFQDNVLCCSQGSDPHSIFLELSGLLCDGNPVLDFANFLHIITTMAESGATEEQTELFILYSQKVPKLPAEKSCWSFHSVSLPLESHAMLVENFLPKRVKELNSSMFARKTGINSNWRPGFSSGNALRLKEPASSGLQIMEGNVVDKSLEQTGVAPVEIVCELSIDDGCGPTVTSTEVLRDADIVECQPTVSMNLVLDSVDHVGTESINFERDQLPAEQALHTGRLGEMAAFKYLLGKTGDVFVNWVNEAKETGLPYDIIVGSDEVSREYIEVKATKSEGKNWFFISMREWQFAIEKGKSYSIAHVDLSDNDMAGVTIYKDPARLCQLGNMKLAVLMPKQHELVFKKKYRSRKRKRYYKRKKVVMPKQDCSLTGFSALVMLFLSLGSLIHRCWHERTLPW